MLNKNVFTQTDAVADLIKGINEADYKAKMEAFKGNPHNIDKNKNNKIDAHDFKILRGEKKVNEEEIEEDSNVLETSNTDGPERFNIILRVGNETICHYIIDAKLYPPKVRYTLDVRPSIKNILRELTDIFSAKNLSYNYLNYSLV